MRLKIEQADFNPGSMKVWLDGNEIRHVRELTLELGEGQFTTATMTIAVAGVDVDVESAARLIAMIRESAAEQEAFR